jgi:ubiquinone/menaquinone biosynthesis C-methylase UbiE
LEGWGTRCLVYDKVRNFRMTRNTSHFQSKEPLLEYFLRWMRQQEAKKFIRKGYVVADLGCGFKADFLIKLSPIIKWGEGYDVAISNENLPANIKLVKANLNGQFGKKRNYFDVAVALAVIEHINKPDMFIKQVSKMLKTTGKIIITTPHKIMGKSLLEFLTYKINLLSREEIGDHKTYFDEKSLRKVITDNGFKIIKLGTFELGTNLFCVAQKI